LGFIEYSLISHFSSAQRDGSPAAGFGKATNSENHFFYQMAAADRAEGGQVEPVLGSACWSSQEVTLAM
jgi:hypothetical protein